MVNKTTNVNMFDDIYTDGEWPMNLDVDGSYVCGD